MTTRVLPVEEWGRLAGTLLESIASSLNPAFAEVLVVEKDGAIVGGVALLQTLHAECLFTDGVSTSRALVKGLRDRVHAAGGSAVWGACVDAPMRRVLSRHAEPIPGEHFLVRV